MTLRPGDPPRPVSERLHHINITGYLLPWLQQGTPVYCSLAGTPDIFLPVFSTKNKLDTYFDAANLTYDSIKKIDEMWEFLSSFPYRLLATTPHETPPRIRIIVDPWVNELGNTRFIEIHRPSPNVSEDAI